MRRLNLITAASGRGVFFASSLTAVFAAAVSSLLSQQAPNPEISTQETPQAFQLKVQRNLVVVRVIVRDREGRVQRDLSKEDFAIFDNGKPQVISHFSVEKSPGEPPPAAMAGGEKSGGGEAGVSSTSAPRRFLALYFDDVHLEMQDIMTSRDAAAKYLKKSLGPGDRAAIYTSSGQITLDFTSDQKAFYRTLQRLLPRPVIPETGPACPDIGEFQAFKIVEENDARAIAIATEEGVQCNCTGLPAQALAECRTSQQRAAFELAVHTLGESEESTEYSLRGVEQILRRMAALPGQRSLILVSPGFLTATRRLRVSDVVERALRSNVIVSALDARGLWANPSLSRADANPRLTVNRPDLTNFKAQELIESETWMEEVMSTVARDTGGIYFHNSNDLGQGFLETGSLPEISYVLAFSPAQLKRDGRFHTVTVKLAPGRAGSIQARRGYFAPSKTQDAAAEAKEELRGALFSQEDVNELPSDLRTQYFRLSQSQARLSVFTHVDIGAIHFEKEKGLNLDQLTILVAVFDENGNVVEVKQKMVTFHLRDETLDRLRKSGLTARTSFDVKPGNYLLRQVVRDATSSVISGLSRSVQITF